MWVVFVIVGLFVFFFITVTYQFKTWWSGDPAWADSFACSLPACRSKGQIIRAARAADCGLNVIIQHLEMVVCRRHRNKTPFE